VFGSKYYICVDELIFLPEDSFSFDAWMNKGTHDIFALVVIFF